MPGALPGGTDYCPLGRQADQVWFRLAVVRSAVRG